MRKHFFNENYFENIDSEDKAYWLGFIAADGSISESNKNIANRLNISLSPVDKGHLEKFLKCIDSNDIEIKTYDNNVGFSKNTDSKISVIRLNSAKICADLSKYHIHNRKSYDIELPDIDSNLMIHYIRGFFDGDGSYHCHYDKKNNRYRYSFEVVGGSYKMLTQIQQYLKSVGITTYIYDRKSKTSKVNIYRLMTGSKKEMLNIINLLYDNASIYLDRKYNKINEIKNIAV